MSALRIAPPGGALQFRAMRLYHGTCASSDREIQKFGGIRNMNGHGPFLAATRDLAILHGSRAVTRRQMETGHQEMGVLYTVDAPADQLRPGPDEFQVIVGFIPQAWIIGREEFIAAGRSGLRGMAKGVAAAVQSCVDEPKAGMPADPAVSRFAAVPELWDLMQHSKWFKH